jgi:hypothetical protein
VKIGPGRLAAARLAAEQVLSVLQPCGFCLAVAFPVAFSFRCDEHAAASVRLARTFALLFQVVVVRPTEALARAESNNRAVLRLPKRGDLVTEIVNQLRQPLI